MGLPKQARTPSIANTSLTAKFIPANAPREVSPTRRTTSCSQNPEGSASKTTLRSMLNVHPEQREVTTPLEVGCGQSNLTQPPMPTHHPGSSSYSERPRLGNQHTNLHGASRCGQRRTNKQNLRLRNIGYLHARTRSNAHTRFPFVRRDPNERIPLILCRSQSYRQRITGICPTG